MTDTARKKRRRVRTLKTQLGGAVLRADRRSREGRALLAEQSALRDHLGGDLTHPQEVLVSQASRLTLLENAFWAEINDAEQLITKDGVIVAVDALRSIGRDLRQCLTLLGLERRMKDTQGLRDILAQHERADNG